MDKFEKQRNSVRLIPVKETGPKAMPPEGKTLVFPREDNLYKKKQSLPYDEVQTKVWRDRPTMRKRE